MQHTDDDIEPLPDWMNPETYRNPKPKFRQGPDLNKTINDTLKKPPIDLTNLHTEWDQWKPIR